MTTATMNFGWRAISLERPADLGAAEVRKARRAEKQQDDEAGKNGEQRLPEIARREQIRRHQVLGEDHELRPEDRGEQPAGHHPGDGLRLELGARRIGRTETVRHVRGRIESAEERSQQKQQEAALDDRGISDQPGDRAANRRADIGGAAPIALGEEADRQRAGPDADHHHADRQGREALVRRQHRSEDAGGCDDHRVVAARKRLADREHQRIALGEAVTAQSVDGRFGNRRHYSSPAEDSGRMGRPFYPLRENGATARAAALPCQKWL